jgi:hypothetical protein
VDYGFCKRGAATNHVMKINVLKNDIRVYLGGRVEKVK